MLYLVPTPIGNLEDMTIRSIRVLKEVDFILAEDTRISGKLLKHFEISTRMRAYHAHNEHKITKEIIEELLRGADVALITDAGTPAISDPGFLLVRTCHQANIQVTCLPGASALIPALAMSGIPCDRFYFEGFLPQKKGRKSRWEVLRTLETTLVFYESPYRLSKFVKEAKQYLEANRTIAIIKEISKIHETIFTSTLENLDTEIQSLNTKGEFVIIIGPS